MRLETSRKLPRIGADSIEIGEQGCPRQISSGTLSSAIGVVCRDKLPRFGFSGKEFS